MNHHGTQKRGCSMSHPSNELVESPTHASRIPIFAPTRRPSEVKEWRVETAWGWAVITGKLGQQHRDLLDASRMVAEREEWTADGRFHLLVDPAKLRAVLGGDATNYARIDEWFDDLMEAKIKMRIEARDTNILGGIVDSVVDSAVATPNTRAGAFSEGRRYWKISFNIAWTKLVKDDLATKYPVREVVKLRYGISQAVARYCLTHKEVHESLKDLMTRLADDGRVRNRRKELAADAAGLKALGITVEGDRVKFTA